MEKYKGTQKKRKEEEKNPHSVAWKPTFSMIAGETQTSLQML